ncbi:MAG: sulfatase [Polyangiaceae bacterium]|nr:sulfatase [Polyangiaceae bacterium]
MVPTFAGELAVALAVALTSLGCSQADLGPLRPSPKPHAAAVAAPDAAAVAGGSRGAEAGAPPPRPMSAPPSSPSGGSPVVRARPAPPANANVILLSIDSLRADMPWAGYERPIAPRITAFEATAVDFTHAYSASSYTSMSLGGLLGGRPPSELRRSGYFFGTYKGDVFFPKLLQHAGVHTMGVMAHMYFKSAGFDQGFDDWRLVPGITFDPNTDRDITSPAHERLAEEMLGDPANDTRRFFFWAHFLDPHDQYQRHEGIDWGRSPRDRYDGEVTFTDRYFGKLLDFIAAKPWAARTVIIMTADHGEEFGEHGMTRHGFEVWNTLVHVPLMVLAPGAAPRHIDVLRSGLDLAPTILELFGVPADAPFAGKSLVSEVYGGSAEERDVIVDLPATSDNGRRRALVHGDQKIICFDPDTFCKLFDLAADPLEKTPIVKGADFKEMRERYRAAARTITEVVPYACGPDCLNNGYRKK